MAAIAISTYTDLGTELLKSKHLNVHRKHGVVSASSSCFFSIIKLDSIGAAFDGHISGPSVEIRYRIDKTQQVIITNRGQLSQANAERLVLIEVKKMVARARSLNISRARAASAKKKQGGRRGTKGEYYLESKKTASMSAGLVAARKQGLISDSFAKHAHTWSFAMWKKQV